MATAREAARAWADLMWSKCNAEERDCPWAVVRSLYSAKTRAATHGVTVIAFDRAARKRWRELQKDTPAPPDAGEETP